MSNNIENRYYYIARTIKQDLFIERFKLSSPFDSAYFLIYEKDYVFYMDIANKEFKCSLRLVELEQRPDLLVINTNYYMENDLSESELILKYLAGLEKKSITFYRVSRLNYTHFVGNLYEVLKESFETLYRKSFDLSFTKMLFELKQKDKVINYNVSNLDGAMDFSEHNMTIFYNRPDLRLVNVMTHTFETSEVYRHAIIMEYDLDSISYDMFIKSLVGLFNKYPDLFDAFIKCLN